MRRPFSHDPRYSVTSDGRVFRDVDTGRGKPRELRQYGSKRGYLRVQFEGRFWNVHQLVAVTFIANTDAKPEVAHNNGDKQDNRVANLRWATRKENADDMAEHGSRLFGDTHPSRVLSEDQVRQIYAATAGRPPRTRPYHRELAEHYGVTRECITRIANGNRWAHATSR